MLASLLKEMADASKLSDTPMENKDGWYSGWSGVNELLVEKAGGGLRGGGREGGACGCAFLFAGLNELPTPRRACLALILLRTSTAMCRPFPTRARWRGSPPLLELLYYRVALGHCSSLWFLIVRHNREPQLV